MGPVLFEVMQHGGHQADIHTVLTKGDPAADVGHRRVNPRDVSRHRRAPQRPNPFFPQIHRVNRSTRADVRRQGQGIIAGPAGQVQNHRVFPQRHGIEKHVGIHQAKTALPGRYGHFRSLCPPEDSGSLLRFVSSLSAAEVKIEGILRNFGYLYRSNPAACSISTACSRPHIIPSPVPPSTSPTGMQCIRLTV